MQHVPLLLLLLLLPQSIPFLHFLNGQLLLLPSLLCRHKCNFLTSLPGKPKYTSLSINTAPPRRCRCGAQTRYRLRPRYCLSIQCRRPSLPPSSVGGRWRLTFLNVSRASPPLEDYPQQLIDAKQRGKREGREARCLSGSSPPWCRFSEIEDR